MGSPSVTVIVAGFAVREPSWDRLRSCLGGIMGQDADVAVEVILAEMPELNGEVPDDIREMVTGLRVVPCLGTDLNLRKTACVKRATAPIVAFIDADCIPQRGWLAGMLETFRYDPEVAMVRGQSSDAPKWQETLLRAVFPRRTEAGRARASADHNVAFRREAYLDCPLPEGAGASAIRQQTKALRRARYVLWEQPAMKMLRDRRGMPQAGMAADLSTVSTR
jgi:hypothetical protein